MKRPSPWTLLSVASFAATASGARVASAEPPPAVDVVIREPPPPQRTLTLEWNPLDLIIERVSVNVIVTPGDHHALILSPFYTYSSTAAFATNIDGAGNTLPYTLNVLSQSFTGFGGELGYRYYLDKGGPRGFFVGPSFIVAGITGKAGNGSDTSFFDLGVAADIGYQMLVADRISLSLGGGVQYVWTTKSIPDQQLPSAIYANNAFRPRLLLSVGYAF